MIYVFPRLWRDEQGNRYRRRGNPIRTPQLRAAMPYPWLWRRVRRIIPGIWWGIGSEFNLDDFGFVRGKR